MIRPRKIDKAPLERGTKRTAAPREDAGVRERIVAAARIEFAERGLGAASVHTIAERSGVTAAMINYYFGGKDALYEGIVAEAQEKLRTRLLSAAEGEANGMAVRLAGAYFDFLAQDRALQRLLLREVIDRGDALRKVVSKHIDSLRALFVQWFGDEHERRQRAVTLFGAVAGYFIYEPLLGPFIDAEPLSTQALATRREHVLRLAQALEEMPCSNSSRTRSK
ncbi:MAG: TetR/AcrR family transcriptional regulator [Polyangiaceae bacterium]